MLEGFKMEISTADMLRVINRGIGDLAGSAITRLIEQSDRVVRVQYSRRAKRYTLVFESGRKVAVVEKKEPASSAAA